MGMRIEIEIESELRRELWSMHRWYSCNSLLRRVNGLKLIDLLCWKLDEEFDSVITQIRWYRDDVEFKRRAP
jgi:hypothetical protein